MHKLNNVSVLIKTFLRDGYLLETVAALRAKLPEVQILVVDDGLVTKEKENLYASLEAGGHCVKQVPFDSGFGFKSNVGVFMCERDYLLIGSDDFDFRPDSVRAGIEKLVTVLDEEPSLSIVSGRVRNNPYEGLLTVENWRVTEKRVSLDWKMRTKSGIHFVPCDLTVNYSLIRRDILGLNKIHWDDEVKIGGGEHGAFFFDVKMAGHKVAYVPGVDINEQPYDMSKMDSRYPSMRARARQPQRPCFVKRGIREYVCFGGNVEKAL